MLNTLKRASLAMLSMMTALLLTFAMPASAEEQSSKVIQQEITQLAGADYWREVREGQEGYTTSQSPEHGVLISKPGETWYILKEKWMSPAGAVAIFGSIAMVIMAYVFVGPLMLSKPRTGKKMKRWSRLDRALHWSMAFTFLTLAFSGLMLVYGKHFLKPYVPTEFWGFIVMLAKQYHNYMGPLFFILLMLVLFKWWRKSIPNMTDVRWFMKMGGMVGKYKGTHPSAGFSNGGEKAIYWLLIFFGAIAAVSGLVLDFPIFGQTRRYMELSNLVHAISALILICGFIFHIYIGLFGMEGALEGMVTGEVDETWAKEHHDLWYEEVKSKEAMGETDTAQTEVKGAKANEQTS
ncbi:formate dehydrogenase subunit gamma [Vibrio alginolyticus]|uniref:formate dehydrogenase subunit gamma n=1 Tax=Vibrio TaxID=662 RepID=UPI001BD32D3F|nr:MULTISPECIES: formate dehydrogenase subunit gamma [Vibrio]EGQ9212453.1 formate dehydrogenase subunit gamma [Vibrio alginolyticus]EGQ9572726.1 formate dehydrogenase subunit gamma [Vibrio alginolyticus]EGR2354141.1 formate dehydrogenase subunit gamma [Vibrio alginolyticus]EIL8372025.1 formate dehydrogenase subunit gamma [Vibrio alginolyticus]EJN3356343.1 formate dehydrogenase subunit gamma [Vibrio alginolyticus]